MLLHSDSNTALNSYDGMRHTSLPTSFPQSVRALAPPGYHKEWHIGVRVSSNKKLVAFISGVPMKLRVRKK